MKKQKLNYHVGLTGASVYKIKIVAAVVFFAVLVNIINLGAFYRGSSVELNAELFRLSGAELSKVFNRINLPVKIAGDLFKADKAAGNNKSDAVAGDNKFAVIAEQGKRVSTAELSKKNVYMSVSELKILNVVPIDTGQSGSPPGFLFLYGNFIMALLLILLLMSVLPRGVPSKKTNNVNIFTHPVFI
jgi:hypothetical protein